MRYVFRTMAAGVLGAALAAAPAKADRVVLDFDQVQQTDGLLLSRGSILQENGFTLEAQREGGSGLFNVFGGVGLPPPFAAGGITLGEGHSAVLTKDDGSTFALESIELMRFFTGVSPTVAFNGVTRDGEFVTQTFTLPEANIRQSFQFGADFGDVISVSFNDLPNQTDDFFFDTLVLNDPQEASGIPAPPLAAAAGLAAIGLLASRRPRPEAAL